MPAAIVGGEAVASFLLRCGIIAVAVPENFLAALGAREDPRDPEQQIREAIEVANRFGPHVFVVRQPDDAAFGAAHDRASEVARRRCPAPSGQNEFLEPGQVGIEAVKVVLEALDERLGYRAVTRDAQFAPEFEQVVLHFGQTLANIGRHRGFGEHHADRAVGFVDRSVGFHTGAVFLCATAVTEAGGAVVSRARINLAEAFTHGATLFSALKSVKDRACVAPAIPP